MPKALYESRFFQAGLFLCLLLFVSGICFARPVFTNDVIRIFADDRHESYAKNVAEQLSIKIHSMHREIGIYPRQTADFVIVPSRPAYQALTQNKAKIVEHSDAFYSASDRTIYIRSPEQISDNYLKILMHEYIHWYVDYTFGRAPLWFHEGMAVEYSYQFGYERYYLFVRSTFWGDKLRLNEMYYRYPEHKKDWNLFYLTSAFVIKYMRDEQPEAWKRFWDFAAREPQASFSNAFYYAYAVSANSFAGGFDAYAKRIGWQYLFIGINGLVFALLPVIMVFGFYKRRRKQNRLPDLPLVTDEEQPSETDLPDHEPKVIDKDIDRQSVEKDEVNLEK